MISTIYEYLYNTTSGEISYSIFGKILETVPKNRKRIQDTDICMTSRVTQSVKRFCDANKNKTNTYAISLSGGIDSMVLATIVKALGYSVVALHINYNNRPETKSEQIFLEKWCHYNDIRLYIKEIKDLTRSTTKRSDYEALTKQIRFAFYTSVLQDEDLEFILLAHHRDDIVENVFANVCRARYILNLAVIKETSEIEGVTICRPLIDHYKDDIINFAKRNDTPYFNSAGL